MKKPRKPQLTLSELREILKKHKGTMTAIADQLGVRTSSVSQTLAGRSASRTIEETCRAKALALLRQEQRETGGAV